MGTLWDAPLTHQTGITVDTLHEPAVGGTGEERVREMQNEGGRPVRLHALTGLRWWAAFGVFCAHASDHLTTSPLWLAWIGRLGVPLFFVLSGFVLAWSFVDGTPVRTTYRRRFARIYPSHLVGVALAVPVWYLMPGAPRYDKWLFWLPMILCLLLLQGWATSSLLLAQAGNPVAWTLSHEAFFYALFPFLVRARAGARTWLVVAALGLASPFLVNAVVAAMGGPWIPSPLMTVGMFITGVAFGKAMRLGWRPRFGLLLPVTVGSMTIAVIYVLGDTAIHQVRLERWVTFPAAAPTCALLIVAVAGRTLAGHRSRLETPRMVALGDWSYAFYLVHFVPILLLWQINGDAHYEGLATLAVVPLALGGAVLLAWAVHRFVEVPAERRLRGESRSETTPVAVPASATVIIARPGAPLREAP